MKIHKVTPVRPRVDAPEQSDQSPPSPHRRHPATDTPDTIDAPMSADDKDAARAVAPDDAGAPIEIGGPKGPEPTRYGDWERKGRCVDF